MFMNARHAARELAVLILNESRILKKEPTKLEVYELIEQAVRLITAEAESLLSEAKGELHKADDQLMESGFLSNTVSIKEALANSLHSTTRVVELMSYCNQWALLCTLGMKHEVRDFTVKLLELYRKNSSLVDEKIQTSIEGWTLETMYSLDRNAITIATVELLYESEISHRIIIDEAIEVAKKYGSEESGSFVNGVLNRVLKTIGLDIA